MGLTLKKGSVKRTGMKKIMLATLFVMTVYFAQSQRAVPTDNTLGGWMDTIVQNAVLPFMQDTSRVGLSIGIVNNGNTYFYNYGTLEKGTHKLPTHETIYEIGSVSKTFTGFLLARAIIDRKIKLDNDIRQYLHGRYPNLSYQGQPIKIGHLVSHTSGLPPFLPHRPDLFQHAKDSIPFLLAKLHAAYTKALFLRDLHHVTLDTIPGFNYRYSNTAAQTLGFILEKVYNTRFEELVKRYISDPLSMKQSPAFIRSPNTWLAKGHDVKGNIMPYMPALMKASGGLRSSTADMVRYIKLQLQEENKVVALSHMPTQRYTDSTAIGFFWRINRVYNKFDKLWHTGGTFGFSSYCVLYPDTKTGIILLSNEFDETSQGGLIQIADKIFASACSAAGGISPE